MDTARLAARLGVTAAALTRVVATLNRVAALPTDARVPALATLLAGSGLGPVTQRDLLAVLPVAAPADLLKAANFAERRLARLVEASERLGATGVEAALLPYECAARVAAAEARATAAERTAAAAEARAAEAERALAAAEARAAEAPWVPSVGSAALDVDGLASSIGQQLGAAQRALVDHPVRLGAVSLTLRGVAESAGGKVGLRFGEAGPASEVRMAFLPAKAPAVVPDVRGYSEPLARRKLLGLGLGVDVAAVPAGAGAVGAVLAQSPDPGAPVTPDLRVRIDVGA